MDVLLTGAGQPDLYLWTGDAAASATWANFKGQFVVPAGYTNATVFHVLSAVGTLSTDDYSVTTGTTDGNGGQPGPITDPASGFAGGLVSVTFDDGLTSTYVNGLPILVANHINPTLYLISDTLQNNDFYDNGDGTNDYMTVADVNNWLAQLPGTELASHTQFHCDLTDKQTDQPDQCPLGLNAAQLAAKNAAELSKSKSDLQAMFPGYDFTDFASPYGAYDAAALGEIAGAGYVSHRSTDGGYNVYGQVDPMNLVVQNVESSTTPEQVKAWIDTAKANNEWLILVYHDVDPGNVGQYGVSAADLSTEMSYLSASGVKVVTIAEGLAASK
jgi:peptidoglycan/xylan/chitin deacetylase (PgdA/CDA1 family)